MPFLRGLDGALRMFPGLPRRSEHACDASKLLFVPFRTSDGEVKLALLKELREAFNRQSSSVVLSEDGNRVAERSMGDSFP